jgi:hypothetical protein
MLRLEMLQAAYGDSLLLEYGSPDKPRRILIDGGPYYRYDALRERLLQIPPAERTFELLVITHVDADHIDGIIRLLQDSSLDLKFRDIWFNDWEHLQPQTAGVLGAKQGEFLGALLERDSLPWNRATGGKRIVVPDSGELPTYPLDGGARITLLSPGPAELENLRQHWNKVLSKAHFTPGDRDHALAELERQARYGPPKGMLGLQQDSSEANGSSIAFMFSYEGKHLLLAGDAWAPVLERSLQRFHEQAGVPQSVEAFKLPHHGSFSNLSKKLVRLARARRYLVSTDGAYFKHPDQEALQLIVRNHGGEKVPDLVFNYRSDFTEPWADPARQESLGYTASYPEGVPLEF